MFGKPAMNEPDKRDWEKTVIHGVCGAVVGAGMGFYSGGTIAWAVGGAIGLGILAAIFLDDFWELFLRWWRCW
jgi:hypothetical protein